SNKGVVRMTSKQKVEAMRNGENVKVTHKFIKDSIELLTAEEYARMEFLCGMAFLNAPAVKPVETKLDNEEILDIIIEKGIDAIDLVVTSYGTIVKAGNFKVELENRFLTKDNVSEIILNLDPEMPVPTKPVAPVETKTIRNIDLELNIESAIRKAGKISRSLMTNIITEKFGDTQEVHQAIKNIQTLDKPSMVEFIEFKGTTTLEDTRKELEKYMLLPHLKLASDDTIISALKTINPEADLPKTELERIETVIDETISFYGFNIGMTKSILKEKCFKRVEPLMSTTCKLRVKGMIKKAIANKPELELIPEIKGYDILDNLMREHNRLRSFGCIEDRVEKQVLIDSIRDNRELIDNDKYYTEADLMELDLKKSKIQVLLNMLKGEDLYNGTIIGVELTPWIKATESNEIKSDYMAEIDSLNNLLTENTNHILQLVIQDTIALYEAKMFYSQYKGDALIKLLRANIKISDMTTQLVVMYEYEQPNYMELIDTFINANKIKIEYLTKKI
ncbi:MAG: hypothetical protein ACRCYT_05660, partial [Cetobacterium sp.]